jgi:hypothetical protein
MSKSQNAFTGGHQILDFDECLDNRLISGRQVLYANWTWKRLMAMLPGSSYCIYCTDVVLERDGGIG